MDYNQIQGRDYKLFVVYKMLVVLFHAIGRGKLLNEHYTMIRERGRDRELLPRERHLVLNSHYG